MSHQLRSLSGRSSVSPVAAQRPRSFPRRDRDDRPDLRLPEPRGPLSGWVLHQLRGHRRAAPVVIADQMLGDDAQLALYLAYEPHFSDLPELAAVDEWDVTMFRFRRQLETALLWQLWAVLGDGPGGPVDATIRRLLLDDDGPSLSAYMEATGTLAQIREFVVHRSVYQLKEADAHTFGIPRLRGRAKQLLAEIQAGEYGADGPGRRMHAELFATTIRELGLDDRLHAYLDEVPASALLISNLISLFGLNRRLRGALVGHLAVFEMTSVVPMGRYTRALQRMGASEEARRFYDVHVLADAEHETAALDMAVALANDEPQLAGDIVFGARCAIAAEHLFAGTLLERWSKPRPRRR